jgi:hypothetical protein
MGPLFMDASLNQVLTKSLNEILYPLEYHPRALIGNFGVRGKESLALWELENISNQPQV